MCSRAGGVCYGCLWILARRMGYFMDCFGEDMGCDGSVGIGGLEMGGDEGD